MASPRVKRQLRGQRKGYCWKEAQALQEVDAERNEVPQAKCRNLLLADAPCSFFSMR